MSDKLSVLIYRMIERQPDIKKSKGEKNEPSSSNHSQLEH